MQRHRSIAGSPLRDATQAWSTLVDLVATTLAKSPHLDEVSVRTELAATDEIGPRLVAGGHLAETPLVLVAENLEVRITVASGAEAFAVEENLAPVPGGGTAKEWRLHLPTPPTLAAAIDTAVAASPHLTTDAPLKAATKAAAAIDLIDLEALARLDEEHQ